MESNEFHVFFMCLGHGVSFLVPNFLNGTRFLTLCPLLHSGVWWRIGAVISFIRGGSMNDVWILVADDEKEIADLIAIHLEKEGYSVVQAVNGEEAIQIINNQRIDLVILDIMMPKMDGYEVTQHIRQHHNMPIIFLSAKTSDFDKVHGLAIGADDYMT